MLARDERQRLLAATINVYAEGRPEGDPQAWAERLEASWSPQPEALLDAADEEQVAEVRAALLRIVAAVAADSSNEPPPLSASRAAIWGAEALMRCELLLGRRDWPTRLLPTFTFLASLPFLDRQGALRLSARVQALVDALDPD